jgi:hypothetical protein
MQNVNRCGIVVPVEALSAAIEQRNAWRDAAIESANEAARLRVALGRYKSVGSGLYVKDRRA